MDRYGKTLRFGSGIVVGALVLRLALGGAFAPLVKFLTAPETASMLLFLETGRVVRPTAPGIPTEPTEATAPETAAPETQPKHAYAVFSPADADLVEVNSACGYTADVEAGLTQTLRWDLTKQAPTVLILHSHGSESYAPDGEYVESSPYRTLDVGYNVVSVGDRLVQVLETGGVGAVHDRQLHDSPSYSNAYGNSRSSIESYLAQHPSIRLVLDIHRDSVEDSSGEQLRFTTTVDGQPVAQLMLVVGTDASGLSHPDWEENMSLAVKLHAQLEKMAPGICRPISLRSQRFNQDLSPGTLIIEVGSAGNTRQEALAAVEILGKAILELSHGTQ